MVDVSKSVNISRLTAVPIGSRVTVSLVTLPDSAILGHRIAWRGRVVDVDPVALVIDAEMVRSQLGWEAKDAIIAVPWTRIDFVTIDPGAAR